MLHPPRREDHGKPYYVSIRLVSTLVRDWQMLDGYAVSHGLPDLRETGLDRVCNFVYWWLTRNADQSGLDKFKAKLWMPPKGVEPDARSPWAPENENAALKSVAASLGLSTKPAPKAGAA